MICYTHPPHVVIEKKIRFLVPWKLCLGINYCFLLCLPRSSTMELFLILGEKKCWIYKLHYFTTYNNNNQLGWQSLQFWWKEDLLSDNFKNIKFFVTVYASYCEFVILVHKKVKIDVNNRHICEVIIPNHNFQL